MVTDFTVKAMVKSNFVNLELAEPYVNLACLACRGRCMPSYMTGDDRL